jgi:hypothetical protein
MKMGRLKKVQQNALLEPEQVEALRALCARTRVPMQTYLREGVDLVLARHSKRKESRRG